MYEDVCLQCGRPSLLDGRAYCSDDCESLDATSPSISTSSSALPSPHLPHATAVDRDIPVLLPSALGGSPLHVYSRYRKMNNTYSCDDHEDDVDAALEDDLHYHDSGDKSSSPFLTPVTTSGLSYARRPSSTNHHSTVPLLHRRSSSGTSSPTLPMGIPRSAPSPAALAPGSSFTEDESSDVPEQHKDSTMRLKPGSIIPSKTTFKKRNRASLPAYFSLLQLTPTLSPPKDSKHKSALSSSRSVPKSPTIRTRDRGLSITAPSTSAITPTTVLANNATAAPRGRERGRSRRRGEGSSSSSANRSRSRRASLHVNLTSPSPCRHLSQKSKRLDSLEKVAEWVSSSVNSRGRASPAPHDVEKSDVRSERVSRKSESEERRGRRRAHELDLAPGEARGAPGFGNGRSGIRDRERRGFGLGLAGLSLSMVDVEKVGE